MNAFINAAPGVFAAPGFLSKDSSDHVVRALASASWTKAFLGHYRDDRLIDRRLDLEERDVEVYRLSYPFDRLVPGFSTRVTDAVSNSFGLFDLTVDGFIMSRYLPGCHIKPHSDTGVSSTSRIVTCIQYFNDEYTGGSLYFPKLDIELRPRAGEMVMFYSEYPHAVCQITSGVRYCMVSFARATAMLKLS